VLLSRTDNPTDVAESSITIDGIKFVIDAGLVKSRIYDPKKNIEYLHNVPISKAQCLQRTGRAGRVSAVREWEEGGEDEDEEDEEEQEVLEGEEQEEQEQEQEQEQEEEGADLYEYMLYSKHTHTLFINIFNTLFIYYVLYCSPAPSWPGRIISG